MLTLQALMQAPFSAHNAAMQEAISHAMQSNDWTIKSSLEKAHGQQLTCKEAMRWTEVFQYDSVGSWAQ